MGTKCRQRRTGDLVEALLLRSRDLTVLHRQRLLTVRYVRRRVRGIIFDCRSQHEYAVWSDEWRNHKDGRRFTFSLRCCGRASLFSVLRETCNTCRDGPCGGDARFYDGNFKNGVGLTECFKC